MLNTHIKRLLLSGTIGIALLSMTACDDTPEETVDFDDLAPVSDKYRDGYKDKEDTLKANLDQRPDASPFLHIVDTLLDDSRWVKWDTVLFPDRFGPESQEKWFAINKTDSLVLLRYTFKDSLRTKNAFFNWIDCFGKRCSSYTVGDNIRIPKRNALLLVGAKELLVIEGNKPINEKKVRASLQEDPEKESWLYLITIPKSGKSTWKRVDKGEEQPIVKTDEDS